MTEHVWGTVFLLPNMFWLLYCAMYLFKERYVLTDFFRLTCNVLPRSVHTYITVWQNCAAWWCFATMGVTTGDVMLLHVCHFNPFNTRAFFRSIFASCLPILYSFKTCMRDKGVKNVIFNLVAFIDPY